VKIESPNLHYWFFYDQTPGFCVSVGVNILY
jgi:hypothetical protein